MFFKWDKKKHQQLRKYYKNINHFYQIYDDIIKDIHIHQLFFSLLDLLFVLKQKNGVNYFKVFLTYL